MEHTDETKEAQMSDVERVRIEFNLSLEAYRYGHPVAKAIQALYSAVLDDAGSFRAANWTETMVEEDA